MLQKINQQLNIIQRANEWSKANLKDGGLTVFHQQLVEARRQLKKKKFAFENNPAAAIYGASQMGKSYLVGSLLSEDNKPFTILDGSGNTYDFINEINPIGGKTEATGLVTRFTTNLNWQHKDFPIVAKLLRPGDLVAVLCDSFYLDVKTHNDSLTVNEINSEVNQFKDKYSRNTTLQSFFSEDDVIDIRDYFREQYSIQSSRINDSLFFNIIPEIIEKVPSDEWHEVFALVWNKNTFITNFFRDIIQQYKKLSFKTEIYLPIDSVLRNYGTLLDVARLREIYSNPVINETYKKETSILLIHNGIEQITNNVSKSYLCALIAELIFKLPEELNNKKDFLKNTDLLDFPGARNRLGINEAEMSSAEIPTMMLRGKVSFLFNKYSESEKVNILLFCQSNEKSEVQNIIPDLLNNWIKNMIGKTTSERSDFVKKSKISPLFIVSTMFNIDLQFNANNDTENNDIYRNDRWKRRFGIVFKEIFGGKDWLTNWVEENKSFNNTYLLRDFFYSSEGQSSVFKGYNSGKKELEEIIPTNYPNFRDDLKASFIKDANVIAHFSDPGIAWDESASMNKDGSDIIIQNLNIVSEHINQARINKVVSELKAIATDIDKVINRYYHSNDRSEELLKAKTTAGEVQQCLDRSFSGDGIKHFGILMKDLLIGEHHVLDLYKNHIQDIEQRDIVNMDNYNTIRMHVPTIPDDSVDSYFERLCHHYEKNTDAQKIAYKNQLIEDGIDISALLSMSGNLVKNTADQLANTLIQYWLDHLISGNHLTLKEIFKGNYSGLLHEIKEMYQLLFIKVDLEKKIARSINPFVFDNTGTAIPYQIIADISAELLNNCITSVGYAFFENKNREDLKALNEKNNLGLKIEEETISNPNINDLLQRIDTQKYNFQNNPGTMRNMPNYKNYLQWYSRLKTGFVYVCDIPNYDVNENARLGAIINDNQTIKY